MEADELKAYFDSSPNELKNSINGVIDDLVSQSGARNIGFAPSANVQAVTVQDAVENVQAQLKNIALGAVPDGSITQNKLSQDVLNCFADIQTQFANTDTKINEASAAGAQADSANKTELQNNMNNMNSSLLSRINANSAAISTVNNTLALKTQCTFGSYVANGNAEQFISLGYTPKAVLALSCFGVISYGGQCRGGLALLGKPSGVDNGSVFDKAVEICEGGFKVFYDSAKSIYVNYASNGYYIAFQ